MRILFSSAYGGTTYTGSEDKGVLLDASQVDEQGLINLLQLHAGIHSEHTPFVKRLALYYNAFVRYMADHPDNVLHESFRVAGLGTAKSCLVWREALLIAGWDFKPGISPRLDALSGVEAYYRGDGQADQLIEITREAERRPILPAGSSIVLPGTMEDLHPAWRRLLTALERNGVTIAYADTASDKGDDLSKVRNWLAGTAYAPTLKGDGSLRLLRFTTEDKALAYLTGLDDSDYRVWLNEGNKRFDNWLRMAGRPVAGSVMPNSNPQIAQLFTLGLSLFAYPTNIHTLIQWLVAPIQPLPARLRFKLATSILKEGGIQNDVVREVIKDFLEENKENRKRLSQDIDIFLPVPELSGVNVKRLQGFIGAFITWGNRQRNLAASSGDTTRQEQVDKLVELMDAFLILIEGVDKEYIDFTTLEAWISSLYAPTDYIQYEAEQGSRLLVEQPGAIAGVSPSTVWCRFYDYHPLPLMYDFLSPLEREALAKAGFGLWERAAERRYRQMMLLSPFQRSERLALVAASKVGVGEVSVHPLLNRLQSGLSKTSMAAITVDADKLVTCQKSRPLVDNASSEDISLERPDLIRWPRMESNTSLQELIQDPLDYTLDHLAVFNGSSSLAPADLQTTKGVVAHGVIERIFGRDMDRPVEEKLKAYDQIFNEVVEANGILLLLSENRVSASLFKQQLGRCLKVLHGIILHNHLRVVGCEVELLGDLQLTASGEVMTKAFIDMRLVDEKGCPVIFDFKWTESGAKYKRKIVENRALQLAIYQELLAQATNERKARVAYFILPKGELLTVDGFEGDHVVNLSETQHLDLIECLRHSYVYRREQLMNGVIETSYGKEPGAIPYCMDTQLKGLFPLSLANDGTKKRNYYSNFKCFNSELS